MYLVQRNLEKMADMFFKYISDEGKEHLEIERVCLFGGLDVAEDYLADLGRITTLYLLGSPSIVTILLSLVHLDMISMISHHHRHHISISLSLP